MSRRVFYDPTGRRYGGLPTYPWKFAPEGLATVRQLRALGLRPGGQAPVAQVMWRSLRTPAGPGVRVAYLYEIATALPRRTASPAQLAAIAKALRARRTCPECDVEQEYYIPRKYGACLPCDGWGLAS
ncbi:RRQRL motif-containing zinc-binding protein [Planobispora rosea]|uniref:RRQRL motif-containing zinc-binding protein n=1 Tax=Planobispora rosea TaxID=35762 RepID=UPI00083A29EB|nr:RRQRL motif-containing zinc-binding protein [Planobispora rosea]